MDAQLIPDYRSLLFLVLNTTLLSQPLFHLRVVVA
jgi:hypothetical protein